MKNSINKLVLLICLACLSGCTGRQLYHDTQIAMGTFIEVSSDDRRAAEIVFSEVSRIEQLLSKYIDSSEVSILNKDGIIQASPETFFIIKKSREFSMISGGAFDITVGPLVRLWGFREKKYNVPQASQIKKILALIGSEKIILNNSNNVIKFGVAGMEIDLGAIAKGFAVDCAVSKLRAYGIKNCLINAGGEIYCLGNRATGRPWSVAIQDPRAKQGQLGTLSLENKAVATSGDYEQFFSAGGKRYCHIINPKTGYPAESGVSSVTVIADDCLTADALATAIFVLGRDAGEELASLFKGVQVKIEDGA